MVLADKKKMRDDTIYDRLGNNKARRQTGRLANLLIIIIVS